MNRIVDLWVDTKPTWFHCERTLVEAGSQKKRLKNKVKGESLRWVADRKPLSHLWVCQTSNSPFFQARFHGWMNLAPFLIEILMVPFSCDSMACCTTWSCNAEPNSTGSSAKRSNRSWRGTETVKRKATGDPQILAAPGLQHGTQLGNFLRVFWRSTKPKERILQATHMKISAKYIKMSFCSRMNSCFSFRCSLDRAASSVLPWLEQRQKSITKLWTGAVPTQMNTK